MRRATAAIVAVAMLSTSAMAVLLHVHAYADHDHAEHHHGPASHAHTGAADHHADSDAARLEGCDPGEHAVPVVFTGVTPEPGHTLAPVLIAPIDLAPPAPAAGLVTPSEPRAHSPPLVAGAPLRAPPAVHLA